MDQKGLNFVGLPVGSGNFVPLIILVPNLQNQLFFKSLSFKEISDLLEKLQYSSYFVKPDVINLFTIMYKKEKQN